MSGETFVSGVAARFLVARSTVQRESQASARSLVGVSVVARASAERVRTLAHWTDPNAKLRFTTTYVEVLAITQADLQSEDWTMFKRELFPYNISYDSISAATFASDVIVVDSGASTRISRWDQPLLEFDVGFAVRTMEQLHALIGFFRAMRGRQYGFLFYDPLDYTSSTAVAVEAREAPTPQFTDQVIGEGNGTRFQFQLIKTYSGPAGTVTSSRPICKPIQGGYLIDKARPLAYPVTIGVNGTQVLSGWSVDYDTGIVTFSGSGNQGPVGLITAGFEFFVPVAFNTDRLPVSLQYYGIGEATEVKLIELRPSESAPS